MGIGFAGDSLLYSYRREKSILDVPWQPAICRAGSEPFEYAPYSWKSVIAHVWLNSDLLRSTSLKEDYGSSSRAGTRSKSDSMCGDSKVEYLLPAYAR